MRRIVSGLVVAGTLAAIPPAQAQVASSVVATVPSGGASIVDITPYSTPANSDFLLNQASFANPGDPSRPDEVMTLGYNMTAGGGCLVATDNCLGWVVESHYQPGGPSSAQSEQYLQYRSPTTGDLRPFAVAYRTGTSGMTEEQDFNSLTWSLPGGPTLMTAGASVVSFVVSLNTLGTLTGGNVTSTTNFLTGGGNVAASSTTLGYFYAGRIGGPGYVLDSFGPNYGQIINVDAHTWALAYGGSQTSNGTSVLSWTDNGSTTVSEPLAAPTVQTNIVYSAAGTSLPTCGATTEGVRASVSDANLPLPLQPYASGGTSHVPVYCSGPSGIWIVD